MRLEFSYHPECLRCEECAAPDHESTDFPGDLFSGAYFCEDKLCCTQHSDGQSSPLELISVGKTSCQERVDKDLRGTVLFFLMHPHIYNQVGSIL